MKLDASQRASRAQFERRAACYGQSHILSDTSDVAEALVGLDNASLDPALDVATGGGHTAAHLAARGLHVTATDLSEGMLVQAKKLAALRGLTISTACHTAELLPYGDGAFGLVTCRTAAHHFSSIPDFMREAFRVLRPGGWLLVIDGSAPDDNPVAEEWIHRVEKLRDPSHGRFLSPSSWRALAERTGLVVKRCECHPLKQPNLEWYFDTADTTPENRKAVVELLDNAPEEARQVFGLKAEDDTVVWWWPRMAMLAQRPEVAKCGPQT